MVDRERATVHLETERLLIRSVVAADAVALAALWSDPDVTRHLGGPRDAETVRANVERDARTLPAARLDLWTVIERSSGRLIGSCGLLEKEVDGRAETELVYVLASSAWGQGYATEAGRAIRDHAFHRLGLVRIIALIDPANAASAGVAEKVGLHKEAETRRPNGRIMHVYAMGPPGWRR
jgi:RimJ/RimL family protein N-acetyltransferase